MLDTTLTPTLLIWWRFGYEHGDDDLQANTPEIVRQHLSKKVIKFNKTERENWRWYQVNPNLIVERWDDSPLHSGPNTTIYYLLDKGMAVIEDVCFEPPDDKWKWYIPIADFFFDEELNAWVMKDLFLDICVEGDDKTYQIIDLPDLACALDLKLITKEESRKVIDRINRIAGEVTAGKFPFQEIETAREACRNLGWRCK